MYPLGHYGVALLFAAPVAYVLGRRSGTVFTVFVLLVALLPDIDRSIPYVQHHGVTHTVLFAVVSGLVLGLIVTGLYLAYVAMKGLPAYSRLTTRSVFLWSTAGVFLGVVSHVTADVLVLLPGTQPVSPFWPLFEWKPQFETWPLGRTTRNLLFVSVGLVVHGLIDYYRDSDAERSRPAAGGKEYSAADE